MSHTTRPANESACLISPALADVPPTAIPAEQALLGHLLLRGSSALAEAGSVAPDQFADPLHTPIFQAILSQIEAGPIDAAALAEIAENSGILDDVGGAAYFQQLLTAARGRLSAGDAADLVRDAWMGRQRMARAREGRAPIPDARDHDAGMQHPIHVTLFAIELDTLADQHTDLVAHFRAEGNHETADMMEARAAELQRLAQRARAGQ